MQIRLWFLIGAYLHCMLSNTRLPVDLGRKKTAWSNTVNVDVKNISWSPILLFLCRRYTNILRLNLLAPATPKPTRYSANALQLGDFVGVSEITRPTDPAFKGIIS